MESASSPRVIRFGVFAVDLRSDELFKDGHKIKIQELPFQILATLLEHPGEVVTREELQHRLWPQGTYVDFDHSLNTAVRLLRLALGDSAENPRFIETLPRKGYRFIYPVEDIEPEATAVGQTRHPADLQPFGTKHHPVSSEVTQPLHPPPLSQLPHEGETVQAQPVYYSTPEPEVDLQEFLLDTKPKQATEQKRKRWNVWAIVAISVMLVVTGSFYWMGRRGTREPQPALVPVPFTDYPGAELNPSFSPDGNQVVFAWRGEKQDYYDVYIKQIGSESPRRLTTGPDHSAYPAWSPDGRFIAFLRVFRVLGKWKTIVMMIPANGGAERQLAEVRMLKVENMTKVLCWHPSGKWLAVACDQESADTPSAIYLLSSETGEKRRLTSPPKRVRGDNNPAFSPDGRSLVFVRYFPGYINELYLLPVSAGLLPEDEPKQLTSLNRDTCYPAWMPDGKEIVFASGSKSHHCSLWRIPVSGSGKPRSLPFSGEANGLDPAISLEKHRLVYAVWSVDENIWQCQVPNRNEKLRPRKKLMASTRVQEHVQYSPDGKAIVYVAWTSGSAEIWVCDKEGSNPLQLTRLGGPMPTPPRWSPDGQKIIFALASRGETDLYVIPARGGEIKQLTRTTINELDPSSSRDGNWIYFSSDAGGDFQVWKMPTKGGDAVQVTQKGGFHPQESMDGKTLFYLKPTEADYEELWKVSMEGGEERRVLEKVFLWNFEVKEHGIYYESQSDLKGTPILYYDFATARRKHITTIQKEAGFGFAVSPDEKEILYTQGIEPRSDLMLVENFK